MNLVNLLPLAPEEKVTAMIRVSEFSGDQYLCMVTRRGVIKRTRLDAYSNARKSGLIAIDLDEGDELAWVRMTDGYQRLIVATRGGMAICFDENDVRPMGREAVGVRGIRLRDGDYVVGAARAQEGKSVLTITEKGYGKRTPVEEYRITNRGGLGIKNYQITDH